MAQKTYKLLFNCQKSCKDNTNNRLIRVILIIKVNKMLVKNNRTIQLICLNLTNMFVLPLLFENCKSGTFFKYGGSWVELGEGTI